MSNAWIATFSVPSWKVAEFVFSGWPPWSMEYIVPVNAPSVPFDTFSTIRRSLCGTCSVPCHVSSIPFAAGVCALLVTAAHKTVITHISDASQAIAVLRGKAGEATRSEEAT